MIAQRALLNNTVNGHYPQTSSFPGGMQGLVHQSHSHGQTPDLVDPHHSGKVLSKKQLLPQTQQQPQQQNRDLPQHVNVVNASNLVSASGGVSISKVVLIQSC